ncbi:MAG TPA: hypothetical protein VJ978_00845 [Nitriliruptoraceae bacterium]|nr:hypothetical protein [Nitriliruptoraceae bacterium]
MHVRPRTTTAIAVALALVVAVPAAADGGYLTDQDPFISLTGDAPPGSTVTAIINSGDTLDGVEFQGIPDGIGLAPGPTPDTVDVYVAHEQTTVPFFNSADFQDSSVSKLTLSTDDASVHDLSVALSPELGYLRFCSAFMAGPAEGFDDYVFFTGEETDDIVDVAPGAEFGPDPAIAPQRQGGYAVALNTATGESEPIPGMGRLNHENTVWLPGYSRLAALTTDDTFNGPSSQLYMYTANSQKSVFADKGGLWAFRVTATQDGKVDPTDPFNGANDYLDIRPGDRFSGEFIRVPKDIARGETDLAPQAALEQWSNDNNVFQFIRLEDLAYDPDEPTTVYVADTGRSRVVPDSSTGRLVRGPSGTVGQADNGAIFKFEMNEKNPRRVDGFSMVAQGDDPSIGAYVPFVSPDNLDTSSASLMVQEDTDNAKIWRHDLDTGAWSAVATVNDPGGESSGIVDASQWFGDGTWVLDVQGSTFVRSEIDEDGVLRKLADGQVMLLDLPGS